MKRYYEGEVSIFKREGSPYWTAYYRDGAGRQRKKSLKTKNLKAAQKRAREINVLLESGDEGRLYALRRHRTVTGGEVIERFGRGSHRDAAHVASYVGNAAPQGRNTSGSPDGAGWLG